MNKHSLLSRLFCLVIVLIPSCMEVWGQTKINHLTVDSRVAPLAMDIKTPDLSWQMESDEIGIKQTAYRIVVAADSDFRNLHWDSGTVNSDKSVGIVYGSSISAKPLEPETDYYWKVEVKDNKGGIHSATSTFSTGLMNPRLSAWDGACWIGSNELSLDAASAMLFTIDTKFRIVKGNKASLIFGANDFRFSNEFQNVELLSGENYVRLEFDVSGIGKQNGAVLNVYRVGYAKDDRADVPYKTISTATVPKTNINRLLTTANAHSENQLQIKADASFIQISINGELLIVNEGNPFVTNDTDLLISPFERGGGNFNTYPNLNSIGFYASAGEAVEFTDYRLMNVGQGKNVPLFDASTGATYRIFKDIPGVSVEGNKIYVKDNAFGYADPSYYSSLSMLRREFDISGKKVKKAKAYVTAMGAYEMYINGKRIGEDWFNPGVSQYRETMTYHAYDVTDHLEKGKNAVGAILGPGFYTGYMSFTPGNYNFFGDTEAFLLKLVVTFEDGTKETIVTDTRNWQLYKGGPVEHASMFQGERYNANKEEAVKGWNRPGYNASNWKGAEIVKPRDWTHFDFLARRDNPIREIERPEATRVLKTHSKDRTTYTYDMGVALVGVPSVKIPAGALKQGDVVTFRYGEEIYPGNEDSPNRMLPDGTTYESLYGSQGAYRPGVAGRVLHDTYRAALATDFYTASKADESREVIIEPHFTYRGYRYIQVTVPSRKSPLPAANVKAIVLSSEPVTGSYRGETTDETGKLVNQLYKNIRRSQLGNFFSIPTDCPQRNERMGWTGDAQAYSRTATYNGNVQSFFRQWMVALRNDQAVGGENGAPAGGIGNTVPTYSRQRERTFADGTTWAAAICMVPWQLYLQYGDVEIVKENFGSMRLWLDGMHHYKVPGYSGLSSRTTDLADWLNIDSRTSSDICNNAIYIYMMEVSAVMSDAIGETAYAGELRRRHGEAVESFNKAYIDPATGLTRNLSLTDGSAGEIIDSQTSYATPLNFNLFSEQMSVTAGRYKGLTYKESAVRRLKELAAEPARSGNEGTVIMPFFEGFVGAGGSDVPYNPTENSRPYTITTGFSGTPNILPALSKTGEVETAYRMLACTDFVSWLYPVKLGSTSMWERWNSYELAFEMGGRSEMNSFNHFALGSVGSWIHEYHLGITTDTGGYQHFVLQPLPGGTYTKASGSYDSNYGTIHSSWTADKGQLTGYEFTVPANTSATVYLPVEESSVKGVRNSEGIVYIGMKMRNGVPAACFEVQSGSYKLKLEKNQWKIAD
ncbi:family 78 glycoside hydrolase catalytic domain [Bacteroides sp. 519]|uniref:family 78 glycoside hydrolase catalytic domain n=1 Tax=Bacteroides sp. 519 TaxID=2302937 RepID=UPI0013D8A5A2|nr:family 78 glycoside hydrolase catalytic domain [Bacteroides sp. 519]NDV57036.1 hypothetical protein [Bacteroides sp. 519]